MKYDFEQSDKAFFGHPKPLQTLFFYRALGKIFLLWNPTLTRSLYDCDGQ
ncbi:amino acid/peptide transporter (peptide:H symporter) [Acinetobacter baumannii ABNIH24]|nr:amino acid/peptide transporter (peptide:H symporter) [Acinetobacter baumannii ABNIH24]